MVAGLRVLAIQQAVDKSIYTGTEDGGYHGFGNSWWLARECPFAFQYFQIDALYPAPYFEGSGHLTQTQADELVDYMLDVYGKVFRGSPRSVLDLGPGRGEVALSLRRRGIDVTLVEGTAAGVDRLVEGGIPRDTIVHENIKFLRANLGRFDLVWCTELAEHLEPFFASKIVELCTEHSQRVWFSAADPYRPAHYHHMNEQPIEVWDNLFAHFSFSTLVELDGRHGRASRLYMDAGLARSILDEDLGTH
jgi:Methyltransferase domain